MHHSASVVVIVLLVLFGIYRRTRRTIGFQKFAKGRMLTRMTLFAVIGVIVLVAGYLHPMVYIFDAIGIVAGGILAYYAIRTTSFEWRKDAWFYRPNPWIGVLLLVLFFARIAYRLYEDYALFGATAASNGQSANQAQVAAYYSHEPLTAVILFTLIAYYVVYYTFVIRRERHLETKGEGSSDFDNA